LIGAGDFGTAIVTQSRIVPRLQIAAIADINLQAARSAYRLAGFSDGEIVVCESRSASLRAMENRKMVVVEDASLLMDLPLDVVVTATRIPEAGARYAYDAIQHGKHVVLVDKEADAVVGAVLKRLADQAGVVLTTDDGDQPGLLMGLVAWARALGLEVLAGGKLDSCLYDPHAATIMARKQTFPILPEYRWAMEPILAGGARKFTEVRSHIFAGLRKFQNTGDPVCHMAISANGTGLMPDSAGVHLPIAHLTELPEILCPVEDGGILETRGVVEDPVILYTSDQPHGGGGVYIVVTLDDAYTRSMMVAKGLHANSKGTSMLIYRPYHLCGAETAMSILCAGLLGVATGASEVLPRVDMVARANRDFRAGEIIGVEKGINDFCYSQDFDVTLSKASPLGKNRPLPFFMLYGNRLVKDISAGSLITCDMVVKPQPSVLWRLREQQDQLFF
jgi:predicted homoserine dehydrogenase-like protein